MVAADSGYAYTVPVQVATPFPFELAADGLAHPERSSLRLSEDGKPLGPAHSLHAEIRDDGHGRFSFWDGMLYFSTSDGSDPRSNGRSYVASDLGQLPLAVWAVVILGDVILYVLHRRWLGAFLSRRGGRARPAA